MRGYLSSSLAPVSPRFLRRRRLKSLLLPWTSSFLARLSPNRWVTKPGSMIGAEKNCYKNASLVQSCRKGSTAYSKEKFSACHFSGECKLQDTDDIAPDVRPSTPEYINNVIIEPKRVTKLLQQLQPDKITGPDQIPRYAVLDHELHACDVQPVVNKRV